MKKLLVIVCLAASTAYAQPGYFIKPYIGVGIGGSRTNRFSVANNPLVLRESHKSILLCPAAGMMVGRHTRYWDLSVGLGYQESGYVQKFVTNEFVSLNVKYAERTRHLVLPVVADRRLQLGNGCILTAGLGVVASYNFSITVKSKINREGINSYQTERHSYPPSRFGNSRKIFTANALARVQLSWPLNKRTTLMAGPELQYMIPSMVRGSNGNIYQHNYTATINAGLYMAVGKTRKDRKPEESK